MAISTTSRIWLATGQSSSVLGQETIVLNYDAGMYFELDEVGGFVWSLLQTGEVLSVGEIEKKIVAEFDVEVSVCRRDILPFLESLLHENLIETAD